MDGGIPVIAVLGHRKSGKTTVVETLISELVSKGYRPASAKHISHEGFSMDTVGKDTWRHSAAGANPVVAVSDVESIIKMKTRSFPLERILRTAEENGANILVLEGFSSLTLEDRRVAKIICLRDTEEFEDYRGKAQGDVLAFCSFKPLGKPALSIGEDLLTILGKAEEFIRKRERICEIMSQLPSLDCGKCGKPTCEELAEAVQAGRASLTDCVPLRLKPKLKAKITVEGSEIPVQPFVSEIVRKSILGMVSTLKGVSVEGHEEVKVTISRRKPRMRSRPGSMSARSGSQKPFSAP